jgi:hypothetical protein
MNSCINLITKGNNMSGNAHSSKRNDHSYETLNRNNPHQSRRNDHSYETLNRTNPHQPQR